MRLLIRWFLCDVLDWHYDARWKDTQGVVNCSRCGRFKPYRYGKRGRYKKEQP